MSVEGAQERQQQPSRHITRCGKMGTDVAASSSGGRNGTTRVPIYLNVYDLTPMNGYVYWFGLGIFHSGIEAHGQEYAFGAHDYSTSGVFEVQPRRCPGFTFRRSIVMGSTNTTPQEFRTFIEQCADDYSGNSYHLIAKNCNHFTNDVCVRLTGKEIPGWVNRLAGIGSFCNCLLPESLQVAVVSRPERSEATGQEVTALFGGDNDEPKAELRESDLVLLASPDRETQALMHNLRYSGAS